jgi:hypothetical protein
MTLLFWDNGPDEWLSRRCVPGVVGGVEASGQAPSDALAAVSTIAMSGGGLRGENRRAVHRGLIYRPLGFSRPEKDSNLLEDLMTEQYGSNRMVEDLEYRRMFAITVTNELVKVPGPTDTVLVVGTNPAGHLPPGQQDEMTLSNRDARRLVRG